MKLNNITVCFLATLLLLAACKTQKKTTASSLTDTKSVFVPVSNISLYDKPLDTIKMHITGQKWQLRYSIGGMTGDDKNTFETSYYTLTKDGKLISEKDGQVSEKPYKWLLTRDIFTGDSTYVISGIVNWKVESIVNDTLHLADNYVDGYRYALTRAQ